MRQLLFPIRKIELLVYPRWIDPAEGNSRQMVMQRILEGIVNGVPVSGATKSSSSCGYSHWYDRQSFIPCANIQICKVYQTILLDCELCYLFRPIHPTFTTVSECSILRLWLPNGQWQWRFCLKVRPDTLELQLRWTTLSAFTTIRPVQAVHKLT